MRASLILAACLLSWVMWGIAAECVLHRMKARGDFHRADYQDCHPVPAPPLVVRKRKIGVPPVTDLT